MAVQCSAAPRGSMVASGIFCAVRVEPFDNSLINLDVVCTRHVKLPVCSMCSAAPHITRRECAVQCTEAALTGSAALPPQQYSPAPPLCCLRCAASRSCWACLWANAKPVTTAASPSLARDRHRCVSRMSTARAGATSRALMREQRRQGDF
jgi:hypothetical protein